MQEDTKFPLWLLTIIKTEVGKLNDCSRDFLKKSMECYPRFYELFLNCPKTSEIGVLNNHDPQVLEKYYDRDSLLYFIIANSSENFHFEYVYQMRELALEMHSALEKGAFFAAAILNRSIFELVCTHYYTFRRAEKKFKESLVLLRKATKTTSKTERQRNLEEHWNILIEIHSLFFRANRATSMDWTKYLKQFGFKGELNQEKPIRVKDAIEDIEKVSKFSLMKAYDLMSEFAHPNFGSKTLVINTRRPHEEYMYMDVVVLGDNAGNHEAALFYIDCLSESLYYTLTLACTLHDRSAKFLDVIFEMIPNSVNRRLH